MSADDETPVVEKKLVLGKEDSSDSEPVDSLVPPIASLTPPSMLVPTPSIRNITRDEADMSQSYHEIFDTQGYHSQGQPSPHTWVCGHPWH